MTTRDKLSDEQIQAFKHEAANDDGVTITAVCNPCFVGMEHLGADIFLCPKCYKRVRVLVPEYDPPGYVA